MSKFPEIFVLRHGQTEWNSIGRHQGRLDSSLTEKGRAQAKSQGELLASLLQDRCDIAAYCSPQGRAFDTAGIALTGVGLTAKTDARLSEISFGQWEGLTFDEIADGWPEYCKYADQDMLRWNFSSPGGETYDDVYTRALEFLEHLVGPTVIVTHGITSYVLRGIWLGLEFEELAALQGGQGCVYHLSGERMQRYPSL